MIQRPYNYVTRSGPPEDLERSAWAERFGLTRKQRRMLTDAMLRQLCRCRSNEARKLLLGVK